MSEPSPYAQISTALAIAQGKFHAPKRSKPVTVRTKTGESYSFNYAPLEEIIDAIKQPLAENGLSWIQSLIRQEGGYFINTTILHASGEQLGPYPYPVLINRDGPQGFASGVTYARRYGLSLALGIAPEDDDDANAAEGNTVLKTGRSYAPGEAPGDLPVTRARRPKPPADNVMVGGRADGTMGVPPHDPVTGEVLEKPAKQLDDEYQRHFVRLTNASRGHGLQFGQKAKDKLREEWTKTPAPLQHQLLPNLQAWKQTAEEVDLGFDLAQQ